ncbi:MAG: hypothetical protein HC866_06400 [Leptolyngbyaceae cyanobacterium RU_5_1]|nr:hypothetical protein [Leptolyngbyaceae cyanobacterium RU_5_1]
MPSQLPHYSANERLLCLSNGHGEDVIAIRILQTLQQNFSSLKLAALPLVGEGRAYTQLGIPIIGPVKAMPSGGFIHMDGRQFARDVQSGLLQLTLAQFRAIRHWSKQGGSILAVGDIVPLLLAWLSGAPYAFVGTAKSEYYLRDDTGHPLRRAIWEGWSGSVYVPWERWLMSHPRCRAVFPRDSLTTRILKRWSIPAFDLGNPMMDGLEPRSTQLALHELVAVGRQNRASPENSPLAAAQSSPENSLSYQSLMESGYLRVVLLPGSRPPEAYENWQQILQAMDGVVETFSTRSLTFFGAIAPNLNLEPLFYMLQAQGWQPVDSPSKSADPALQQFPDSIAHWFSYKQATLVLTQHAFGDCLHGADCAIAMTGTGTEQFVGLGKPAVIFPGKGPQFTLKFAESQTRLLGPSVTLVAKPAQAAIALQTLLQDPEQLHRIAENGHRRMGRPGAAERIAHCLIEQLEQPTKNRWSH